MSAVNPLPRASRYERRDRKRHKRRHGQRRSGDSAKLLHKLIQDKADKASQAENS